MLQDYCQIIQHYFLQILFKSVEISCFITKHVGLQFFFLGTVRVLSNFWVIVSVLCRPNVNIQSIWQNYASQHSSRDEATALCTAIIKLHYSLFVVTEAFSSCDTTHCSSLPKPSVLVTPSVAPTTTSDKTTTTRHRPVAIGGAFHYSSQL